MPLNDAALQIGATSIAAAITGLSLHTATPDGTGSNLSAAGKKTITATASGGDIHIPQTAFTGGASSGAIAAVGFWGGASNVTWYGYALLNTSDPSTDTSFNAAGEYTVNASILDGGAS